MAKHPAKEQPQAGPPPFEQSLGELEAIVKQLEAADLPLEKSIELFERGVQLSGECRKQLLDAETRVELLMKRGSQVEPVEFDPDQE
jgi:exodeoxyribonuclease VII small subunit